MSSQTSIFKLVFCCCQLQLSGLHDIHHDKKDERKLFGSDWFVHPIFFRVYCQNKFPFISCLLQFPTEILLELFKIGCLKVTYK